MDRPGLRQARPAAEVLPELFGAKVAAETLRPKRGRPPADHPKAHVNIRLDAKEVVEEVADQQATLAMPYRSRHYAIWEPFCFWMAGA